MLRIGRQPRWRWIAVLVAGVIAALPVLHCAVTADTALPVLSHHAAAITAGELEDASHHIGRAAQDLSSQIFDVIAGKIRSGNAFRMLWAAALVVTMILVLHPLRVVALRAPPRRSVYPAVGRLQWTCVSRR